MSQYPTSIRRRLLLFMLGVLLVVVVATAAITYRVGVHVATHAYDRSLLDPALALAESVHVGPDDLISNCRATDNALCCSTSRTPRVPDSRQYRASHRRRIGPAITLDHRPG
jgi:hypothetical protein